MYRSIVIVIAFCFSSASSETLMDTPLRDAVDTIDADLKLSSSSNTNEEEDSKSINIGAQERFWRSQNQNNNHDHKGDQSINNTDSTTAPTNDPNNNNNIESSPSIPFVKSSLHNHRVDKEHLPPEGFQITARIVSNPKDGLSYFTQVKPDIDANNEKPSFDLKIPYQECSYVGITTPPIPLRHLTFRHLPPAGTNPNWANTGPTPQLVICLHPLQITVSGNNEKRVFNAGDVILLEDIHGRGHKMSGVLEDNSRTEDDLSVLILTLPHPPKHKQHTWNYRNSINNNNKDPNEPCNLENELPYFIPTVSTNPNTKTQPSKPFTNIRDIIGQLDIRRSVLTAGGLVASSAFTYFLGKVAPPVLAVIFGGGCVLVGGTCLVVKGGEAIMDQIEERQNRRRLEQVLSKLEFDDGTAILEEMIAEE